MKVIDSNIEEEGSFNIFGMLLEVDCYYVHKTMPIISQDQQTTYHIESQSQACAALD
jgi:hypothetical protein